jgi:hypothetical protein
MAVRWVERINSVYFGVARGRWRLAPSFQSSGKFSPVAIPYRTGARDDRAGGIGHNFSAGAAMRNNAIFTHNDDAEAVKIAPRARIENVAFVALGFPCASSKAGHAALVTATSGIDSARRCGRVIHQLGA